MCIYTYYNVYIYIYVCVCACVCVFVYRYNINRVLLAVSTHIYQSLISNSNGLIMEAWELRGSSNIGKNWNGYPLVNVYITMENHNFEWVNQL